MVAFIRTTDGLITAVSWTPAGHGAVTLASGAAYAPFGPLAGLTFGNGLTVAQTDDPDYRLARIGSDPILDLKLGWQADGRISSLTDNAGSGRAAAFSYTPSGRVWTAGGPWGTGTSAYAYSYDAAGNQTQAGPSGAPITAIVNSTNSQVSSTSSGGSTQRSLGYTAGGLLTGDQWAGGTNWTFTYNAARRLIQVKANGASSGQYGYDFKGQRVWRLVNAGGGSQAAYVHDEAGHLLAEHSMNTGAMSREYVWLDDTPIATVYLAAGVPTIAYIHTGQIGEPLAMTSASQALLWNGYVDPFGTAGTFSTPTVSLDMRLPGQSAQAEADGFSQNHWRDYDPTLGRYSEPDPLGIDAGQNVYPYVDGDGLNWTDPEGLAGAPAARWWWPTIDLPAIESGAFAIGARALGVIGMALSLSRDTPQPGTSFARPTGAARPKGTTAGSPSTASNCPPGRQDRCVREREICMAECSDRWMGRMGRMGQSIPFKRCVEQCLYDSNCPGGQDWRSVGGNYY